MRQGLKQIEFIADAASGEAGLKILPMKLPEARLAAGIVTVKNRTLSPLAELFIDCARELARSISEPTESRQARSVR